MLRTPKPSRLRGRLSSNVGPQVRWLCVALSARSAAHTRRQLEQPRTRSPPLASSPNARTRFPAPASRLHQPWPSPPFSLLVERRAPGAEAQRPRRAALREGNPCTCPSRLPISAVPVLVVKSLHRFGQFVLPASFGLAGLVFAGSGLSLRRCSANLPFTRSNRPSSGCGPTPRSSRRPTTAAALGLPAPWLILRRSAKRVRLRGRLSSNVGPQGWRLGVLTQQGQRRIRAGSLNSLELVLHRWRAFKTFTPFLALGSQLHQP